MAQRQWKRWVVGAVVVAALGLVGGPFVYIHFIEAKAPANFSLGKSSSGSTGDTPIEGTWNVATGSEAGYRVKEVLFGQSHEAVGRTSGVTGTIAVAGTAVQSGSFTVDLT